MNNQKSNKAIIALLIVIIVILSVFCILFVTGFIGLNSNNIYNTETKQNENINNDNSTELVKYTYDGIKGLYKYTCKTMKDEYGNEYTAFYNLYLYENGTFNYVMGTIAPYGYMGNYIIKDNTIVLNYLFSTNSGAGIDVDTGTKTITITDKNTLVDVNQSINDVNMTSVTLKKASSAEENEFLLGNDFLNILQNYDITNNVSNS